MSWWIYALVSAIAAAATAILAKIGVEAVPSNLATAVRTSVVLVFAWGIVFATGEHHRASRPGFPGWPTFAHSSWHLPHGWLRSTS